MPKFNAVEVKMSSGVNGLDSVSLTRVQSASWNYTIPRSDTRVLGRFKQLNTRPVINYTPVTYSIEMLKSDNLAEKHLGLTHPQGVALILGTGEGNNINNYTARNFTYLISDPSKLIYENQWNIGTGVLTSYTVNASVGDVARVSFGGEAFDLSATPNSLARSGVTYDSEIVKSDTINISGIDFSGIGFTGISIQSFSLGINFNRQSFFDFGNRFPRRIMNEANATLQIQGFVEGINYYYQSLSGFNCGAYQTGTYYFTLVPSCSPNPGTTYQVINP